MAKKRTRIELDDVQRSKLDTEWAMVGAFREAMNVARRQPDVTTYKQALQFGAAMVPEVLAPERRVLHGFRESQEAKYYREQADADTARHGKSITALELIEADIRKLTSQTAALPDLEALEGRLRTLKKVRIEIKPRAMYEGQSIFRDAIKSSRPLPVSGEGTNYREFEIDDKRVLRIRVLHPDPPEHKTGADLVYENYDTEDETVRLAIVQYKVWDRKKLYHNPRMDDQLAKMFGISCAKGGLCTPPSADNLWTYRLP